MSKFVDTIQALTQEAVSEMFAAEKVQDQKQMAKAYDRYAALCAASSALMRMEKRTPKKYSKPQFCRCPSCLVILSYEMRCCDNCGQMLDRGWS